MADSPVVEHNAIEYTVTEYTMDSMERTPYGWTEVAMEQTMVTVTQTVVATVVVASPLIGVLLPSCSTYPSSFLGASHMPKNPCLHDPQNEKKYKTNLQVSILNFWDKHTPHIGVLKFDIFDTVENHLDSME